MLDTTDEIEQGSEMRKIKIALMLGACIAPILLSQTHDINGS